MRSRKIRQLQHRHGITGRPGSIEWSAGVGFVVAMGVAVFAPILQLLGIVAPLGVLHALWIQAAGAAIAVLGIAATVYAQLDGSVSIRARPRRWSAAVSSVGCATRYSPR